VPVRESLLFALSRLIDDTKKPIADVLFLLQNALGDGATAAGSGYPWGRREGD
jgi:hypothetical protein